MHEKFVNAVQTAQDQCMTVCACSSAAIWHDSQIGFQLILTFHMFLSAQEYQIERKPSKLHGVQPVSTLIN